MKKVFVVNEEYYGEWSYDCGANEIIGVYSSLEKALKSFQARIVDEIFTGDGIIISDNQNCIKIKDNIQDVKTIISFAKESIERGVDYYVNLYTSESMFEYNNDNAVIEIKVMKLN